MRLLFLSHFVILISSISYTKIEESAEEDFGKIFEIGGELLADYARIYNNEHRLSNIIFGSAIGLLVGEFVNNHPTNQKSKLIGEPVIPPPQFFSFKIPL